MNKTIQLSDVAHYFDKRIKSEEISLNNFVTTDNLLPDKEGITDAISLPPKGNTMPAFKMGHVLVGNIRPYLKKIWFADRNGGCSNDVLVFEAKYGYDTRFIYYSLFRNDFFEHMMKGKKGTKMPRGDKDQILEFLIPDFNLPTQEKIAKVLSTLDNKIDINKKINAQLEAIANTLFDYWFVQFDFPDKDGKPYKTSGGKMVWNDYLGQEIPFGWETKELGKVATIIAGGDKPGIFSPQKTTDCQIPIYSNGIDNDGLYGYTNKAKIEFQSITISARGTIGYSVLRNKPFVPIIRLIVVTPNLLGSAKYFEEFFQKIGVGKSGSVQQQLTVPQVSKIKFLYPPEILLEKYGQITSTIVSKIEIMKEENQNLANLRDWLLPMLMNGQVKIN